MFSASTYNTSGLKFNLRPLGRFDIQNARNYITGLDRIEEQQGQELGPMEQRTSLGSQCTFDPRREHWQAL